MMKLAVFLKRKTESLISKHIVGWIIYLIYILILNSSYINYFGGIAEYIFAIFINHILVGSHFYFNLFVLFPTYLKKSFLKLFLLFIASFSVFIFIRYEINTTIFPLFGIVNKYLEIADDFATDTIYLYVLWFGYSVGYFYARKSVEQEKELRILQVAKAEAEMKFLKAQINPHFMFNTLNLINGKVMKASKSASAIVLQLSEMFRYMTGTEGQKDLVDLQDEVNFVLNYVDMLNKRNSYTMSYVIDQEGDFTKYQITPMVLVTILENAFKHGEVFNPDCPLIIVMQVNSDNLFTFSTQNKLKVEEQKGDSTGIGISNITQRLKAVHGNAFALDSHFDGTTQEYFCTLTLQY